MLRMYRMMRHKMQRQQTPPRQKASEDIFAVLNTPIFFFLPKKENYCDLGACAHVERFGPDG